MVKTSWLRGSCIGGGAYGTVNLGVNKTTGDVFAVKSVNLFSGLPAQVAALENEIRILKSLSSPFIVKYLGDDTTMEGNSLATSFRNLHMEYLPAGTAADLASMEFDEAAVANYTWCLVSGLSYLHSRGIMHCDVKGKNVLLDPSRSSAKLADFGSAVDISSAGGVTARGSPLWMAPEVIRGEHQGPESDVWSLGCTVIEMVTGKPAWGAEAYSVCRIGYSDELPLFPAQLSCLAIDFLDKCLRRDYTTRWSCDQLLQHPFILMSSQNHIIAHSSPRCVLDWFTSDFHDGDDDEEFVNLGADERIRELVTGAGSNWESAGWLVVRDSPDDAERTCLEYFDLTEDRIGSGASSEYSAPTAWANSNFNLQFLPEEDNYSTTVYDVVAQRHDEPQHFYCKNAVNPRCSQVKRLCECSNFSFISYLYIFRRLIYFIFSRLVNFYKFELGV